jgi:hypothetical protein
MTMRVTIVRLMLWAYPRRWRREYGKEFAEILQTRRLSVRTILDVLKSGAIQRARHAEVWQTGGAVLAVWLILGTTLNSLKPFPRWAYHLFWHLDLCMALVIGYLSVSRDRKGPWAAAAASGKAALIGITPELLLGLMWAVGMIHPTILQSNGAPIVSGHGITDLCIRTGAAVGPFDTLITPFAASIPAFVAGAFGACAPQLVQAFRQGLRGAND